MPLPVVVLTATGSAWAHPRSGTAGLRDDAPTSSGTRRRAPGWAERIAASITPSGAIRLVWRAKDAAASTGAFFTVSRRLAGETGFSVLGTSPGLSRTRRTAEFTDDTVPAGTASAQYQIVSQRANAVGALSDVVTITLGVAPSAMRTAA